MSLGLIIYFADIACSVSALFTLIGVTLVVGYFIFWAARYDEGKYKRPSIACPVIGIILLVIAALIPSEEAIYTMTAAHGIQSMVATPEAAKARQVLNLGMDKIIKNLSESSN